MAKLKQYMKVDRYRRGGIPNKIWMEFFRHDGRIKGENIEITDDR